MPKRMLIDSSHPEETRVVVLDGQQVEEFDFEAASKRPLKGNIYLAKVTRVEPSLQAAFVEYGGNRQGFLAFSEIHPDYYQIPVADRLALLADQEAEARERQEDDIESFEIKAKPAGSEDASSDDDDEEEEEDEEETAESENGEELDNEPPAERAVVEIVEESEHDSSEPSEDAPAEAAASEGADEDAPASETAEAAASENGEDAAEAVEAEIVPEGEEKTPRAEALDAKRPSQRWMRRRHYKIQEVIKRRQIILVQVVKEERGNKGAALTTYLSLAGRYCVLMPNTPRGGGISRKITNANDRKRLKAAAQALDLPEGMGLIIRTAGENRTKLEIKRDYEYLLRLWDTIREITLQSNAPSCVYEEGDLIKRAIRDLYNKDVTEVVVEGEEGYRNAKDFMRMLMPSHAKNVKPYREPVPLFQRHHIEAQLDAMFSTTVTLKSGGYIVINQTEALVAIDVNSGRATREHNIEDTATKTNLEAADEIGRQLRLRDLAGLIVIDFIDMEDNRNDRAVEKRLHNAVKNDRARIQIGKISQFGLLEMSRQRLRAGVIAGSTVPCPHCGGQGIVRSVESTALRVLRGLEEEAQKQRCEGMVVHVAQDVGFYTLNQKRAELARLETEYDVVINFEPREGLKAGDFEIDRFGQRDPSTARPRLADMAPPPEPEPEEFVEEAEMEAAVEAGSDPAEFEQSESREGRDSEGRDGDGENGRRRRRRRRRGGRGRDRDDREPRSAENGQNTQPQAAQSESEGDDGDEDGEDQPALEGQEAGGAPQAEGENGEGGRRRRRRRRRGRRGGRDRDFNDETRAEAGEGEAQDADAAISGDAVAPEIPAAAVAAPAPAKSFFEDRFGNVDEIDTTPRDEPVRPAIEAAPNAASKPVWSLMHEEVDTTPVEPVTPASEPVKPEPVKAEPVKAEPAQTEPVKADTAEQDSSNQSESVSQKPEAAPAQESAPQSNEPPQPPKKGWWQRTFRAE
ncbi:ribonuclease E [Rhizomicrobium palustre]|uniref:Ribonuclease E n=1 Tax=Rhizomicrobium palustre TaxID=189966 RepID=A0A846N268_9PROT|nr:ribonuclease E/G [Rhizomicrobium palustre]NIK89401.1 ribonuclease E [Rhizomicrobium palustre]